MTHQTPCFEARGRDHKTWGDLRGECLFLHTGVLHSSKQDSFSIGGRQNPGVCLRGPQTGGLCGQVYGNLSLITQSRVRVTAKGHGRRDLLGLKLDPWRDDLRKWVR